MVLLLFIISTAAPANPCNVQLVKQLSHAACTFNSTYGCAATETSGAAAVLSMFVEGCSGDFTLGVGAARCTVTGCMSSDFKREVCACDPAPAPTPAPGAPIIGGSGAWRYEYQPHLLALPAGAEVQHCHGLEVAVDGSIYLNYVNWNNGIATNGTDEHCLVKFDSDGTRGAWQTEGGTALCAGTPHGLTLATEGGTEFFYHANCGTKHPRYGSGKLTKTTLNGTIVWQHEGPIPNSPSSLSNYRPTWWAVPPSGKFVYLGDGYGSSNVYVFNREGVFQNHTFGGKGTEHGQFHNDHGLHWDPRTKQIVIADRENHRIEFYDVDASTGTTFNYSHTKTPTYGINGTQRPCNLRVLTQTTNATLRGMAVIADLGADDQSKPGVARGTIAVLDQGNALVTTINIAELLGYEGSVHPHDAIMLANGDIVVATWHPGRITYWKLL
tara:strand:+ start:11 stop:1333 length:1323 start_codon:yes stop_codon:yes gene_type:complete